MSMGVLTFNRNGKQASSFAVSGVFCMSSKSVSCAQALQVLPRNH